MLPNKIHCTALLVALGFFLVKGSVALMGPVSLLCLYLCPYKIGEGGTALLVLEHWALSESQISKSQLNVSCTFFIAPSPSASLLASPCLQRPVSLEH